jgi:hypothetical protein
LEGEETIVVAMSNMPVTNDSFRAEFRGTFSQDPSAGHVREGHRFNFFETTLSNQPMPGAPDLDGTSYYIEVDARNHAGDPAVVGAPGSNADFANQVLVALMNVRPTFPERSVSVGDSWRGDPFEWDTRPVGWVVVNVQPTFTLTYVTTQGGRPTAVVDWQALVTMQPFEVLPGLRFEASGRVVGSSTVRLEQGIPITTDLTGHFDVRPTAGGPTLPVTVTLHQEVRIR